MERDRSDRQAAGPALRLVEGGAAVRARAGPSAFAELDAYWQGLRRGSALPRRATSPDRLATSMRRPRARS